MMRRGTSSQLKIELDVSSVPLGSKGAHDTCVEWLVATVNRRTEAKPTLGKPKNLERETVMRVSHLL